MTTALLYTYDAAGNATGSEAGVRVTVDYIAKGAAELFARDANVATVRAFRRNEVIRSIDRGPLDVVRWVAVPTKRITYHLRGDDRVQEWKWIGKGQRRELGRIFDLRHLSIVDSYLLPAKVRDTFAASVAALRSHHAR